MIISNSLQTAAEKVFRGEFHLAVEELGPRWPGIGIEPDRNGSGDVEHARLLLICGVLTQELGEMRLVPALESAKDFLSKAVRLFGADPGEQQARFWLGLAYLRAGEYREALTLAEGLLEQQTADAETVFCAGRLKGLALLSLGDLSGADVALSSVEVFLPAVPAMSRGRFYLNRGMLLRQTQRYNAALADYDAAGLAFREAGSVRYQAAAENNRAGVYIEQGRLIDARHAAQRAISLFRELGDRAHEAKAWDQLAQVFACDKCFDLMEAAAREAITLLSDGDHDGWLAEALTTHGIACAHLGIARSQEQLSRALAICDRQGDPKQAGLTVKAMWQAVLEGKRLLTELHEAVSPLERMVYERLLEKHGGHVLPASHELGMTHQAFQRRLENHFPELLTKRRPPRKRNKSVIRHAQSADRQ